MPLGSVYMSYFQGRWATIRVRKPSKKPKVLIVRNRHVRHNKHRRGRHGKPR